MNILKLSILLVCLLNFSYAEDLKPSAWILLPAIGSSPETGFQFGAYVMRIYGQTDINSPQNRLELLAQGTANGQYQAYVWPNFYFDEGKYNVRAKLGAEYWPSDYFGEGNKTADEGDSYNDTAFASSVSITRQIWQHVRFGVSTFAEYHDIENTNNAPLILTNDVAGNNGGLFTGVGLLGNYDSRDNLDWPARGTLIESNLNVYTSNLGSDLDFTIFSISGSAYFPIGQQVLAIGGQLKSAGDDTPFTHLPRPTGDGSLRGANGNRWIDHRALGLQTEYRVPVSAKWALVGFVDTFQVASNFDDMAISEFHYSTGLGVRFATTEDRFNIRLDVGLVDAEAFNFALTVGEAF